MALEGNDLLRITDERGAVFGVVQGVFGVGVPSLATTNKATALVSCTALTITARCSSV